MRIMKCDICGVEMNRWAQIEIKSNFPPQNPEMRMGWFAETDKIENKEVCQDCYKMIMRMFDESNCLLAKTERTE